MDVVRSNIERIGGTVEVDSRPGQGTRMTLRVPLTLTIIPALTVSIGSQHFAIPRSAIEEIVRANGDSVSLSRVGGAGVATIRGRRVPEIALADVLGLPSSLSDVQRTLIVLKPAGGDVYALAVDKVHDHEELVVKPAAPAVMATGLYAGTTLADDGSPILLFDPVGLARVGGVRLETQDRSARVVEDSAGAAAPGVSVLLFRSLDGARRAVRLAVVDRIEEVPAEAICVAAGQVRVQLGHAILPLAGMDVPPTHGGKTRIFRLNDGSSEIGLAFREVIDLSQISAEIIPAVAPGLVAGVTLIEGEPAELIDTHWLFARYTGPVNAGERQAVCRLPDGDPWMQHMLRPIVEAAGYRVVGSGEPVEADLVIASETGPKPDPAEPGKVLWLRNDPEARDAGRNSIYRYDRAGLLLALRSAAGGAK
jgi:two-component system chemotaxis sensor kinase CheA